MTALSPILLACSLAAGTACAGESGPNWRPAPGDKLPSYRHLWEKSPFTSPPPVKTGEIADPFADWTLTGVSEIAGGYRVSLSRRSHPDETLMILPDLNRRYTADRIDETGSEAAGAFKVERVEFGADWRDTVVFLSCGGRTGSVRFDEKTLNPSSQPQAAHKLPSPGPASAKRQVQPGSPAPSAGRSR